MYMRKLLFIAFIEFIAFMAYGWKGVFWSTIITVTPLVIFLSTIMWFSKHEWMKWMEKYPKEVEEFKAKIKIKELLNK